MGNVRPISCYEQITVSGRSSEWQRHLQKSAGAKVFHRHFAAHHCQCTNYSILGLILPAEYYSNGRIITSRQYLQNITDLSGGGRGPIARGPRQQRDNHHTSIFYPSCSSYLDYPDCPGYLIYSCPVLTWLSSLSCPVCPTCPVSLAYMSYLSSPSYLSYLPYLPYPSRLS